jgi:hypothetical protein
MIIIQALADGTTEVQEIVLDINTRWIAWVISDGHPIIPTLDGTR